MLELPTIIPLTPVAKLHKVLRDEEKSDAKRKQPQPVQQQDEDKPAEHVDEMV